MLARHGDGMSDLLKRAIEVATPLDGFWIGLVVGFTVGSAAMYYFLIHVGLLT
jgi:hypothetical protein